MRAGLEIQTLEGCDRSFGLTVTLSGLIETLGKGAQRSGET
jgi:hypothetical protein